MLEPWITPSIFNQFGTSVIDEYTLTKQIPNAGDILRNHWDNWVSLADFQKIADNGFNSVRIPIGYWAFQKYEGDPYIQGAEAYLDQGIAWARQTGLKVWIDLHGEWSYTDPTENPTNQILQVHHYHKMGRTILASSPPLQVGPQVIL